MKGAAQTKMKRICSAINVITLASSVIGCLKNCLKLCAQEDLESEYLGGKLDFQYTHTMSVLAPFLHKVYQL